MCPPIVSRVGNAGELEVVSIILIDLLVALLLVVCGPDSLLHPVKDALGHLQCDPLPQIVLLQGVAAGGVIDPV